MAIPARIRVENDNPVEALRGFLKQLLADEDVSAVLANRHSPVAGAVMPSLISDPAMLDAADPLAPAFPLNAATLAARLTRGETGGKIAAVLRPCEVRAFVELAKLNQGSLENILLLAVDCPGACDNAAYREFTGSREPVQATLEYLDAVLTGKGDAPEPARACRVCEHPTSAAADCVIGLFGLDPKKELSLTAQTPKGQGLVNRLELEAADETVLAARDKALAALVERRTKERDAMFAETAAATADMEKLSAFLSGCVNCYNCRVACPVCCCRECVFVTDVFDHKPWQYLNWSRTAGAVKLPVDTVFYHLTRLAHSSLACVGCGQCSNACPNGVPVMELFRMTAHRTQAAFGYEAGRDPEEAPPLSEFQESEFAEVTAGEAETARSAT